MVVVQLEAVTVTGAVPVYYTKDVYGTVNTVAQAVHWQITQPPGNTEQIGKHTSNSSHT